MPRTAYAPPEAPDTIVYFRGDMRSLQSFGRCFAGIERHMGYRQPNILWGTLAMSRPGPMPDGAVEYRIDLPRPVYLSDSMFLYTTDGASLREGHYTGRLSLHLTDARFIPSFSTMDAAPSVRRLDLPPVLPDAPGFLREQMHGHCEITLCLENLRRIELPDDTAASLPARLWATLADMRRSAAQSLTALLHPDVRSDARSDLSQSLLLSWTHSPLI